MKTNQIRWFRSTALCLAWGLTLAVAQAQNNASMVVSNTTLTTNGFFVVGGTGTNNTLTIRNAGVLIVTNNNSAIGKDAGGSNNWVLVTGTDSAWINTNGDLYIGNNANTSYNSLTIANGGTVMNPKGIIGGNGGAPSFSNTVLVTGAGSTWSNQTSLVVGQYGSSNTLWVADGGKVFDSTATIGSIAGTTGNTVVVTDPGSVWSSLGAVNVGNLGGGSRVFLTNGATLLSTNITIGVGASSSGNLLDVAGANLWVTNSNKGAVLNVLRGTFQMEAGATSTVDNLILTNTAGLAQINGGALSIWGSRVDNGSAFAIGNGSDATLNLLGGTNVFLVNTVLGNSAGSTGTVNISAGNLMITNAGGTAQMVVGASGHGALTLNGGTVTVNQLLVTNGANSVVTFNAGTLNANASTIDNGLTFTIGNGSGSNATLNLLGGTNVFLVNTVLGNSAGSTGAVNISAGNLLITNAGGTAQMVVGASGQGTLTLNGGTVTVNQLLVTNGANSVVTFNAGTLNANASIIDNGSFTIGNGSGSNATLNLLGGTNVFLADTVLGNSAGSRGVVLLNGGQLVTTNSAGTNVFYVGQSGVGSMTVSNGTWLANQVSVGRTTGSGTLILAGGTNQFSGTFNIGYNSTSVTGTVLMTGGTLVTTNVTSYVGTAGIGSMTTSGGVWQAAAVNIGLEAGSQGTLALAGGSNVFSSILYVGRKAGATGAVTMSGGYLSTPSIYLGTNATSSGLGSFLLSSGGVLQANTLVSGYNGSGVFTNQSGGVLQFTTAVPTITANSANSIVVTNATIAFKGVANAAVGSVTNNATGLTVQADSRLRLDGSTNATGLANFAVGGAGNYAQLELVGANSLWQSTNLTVGANGAVMANASARVSVLGTYQNLGSSIFSNLYTVASGSRYQSWGGANNQFVGGLTIASGGRLDVTNGQSVIGGTITNAGTMTVFNAQAIYNGNVVNQGAYVSDPSTNTFNGNFTVGPTATVVAAAGDIYAFGSNFVMNSTNRNFNMSLAQVVFASSGYGITTGNTNHTFDLSGSGAVDKGSNWLNHTQLATNFSIGTLTIASGNRLTLTGSAGSNALYVGVLDLSAWTTTGSALTNTLEAALSLQGINLYYDKYDLNNAYLDGLEFDLWGSANSLLIPIPEPSPLALTLVATALSMFILRRKEWRE